MKTIKQIKEEYDSNFLSQVFLPEEIMLEGKERESLSRQSQVPSSREMPAMLVFRRIQYRIFPNRQVVALYYSKMINKYLSIPYGPDGNVNLSEAVIVEDDMLEDWKEVNRKDRTSGMSQKAVNAYRRENPGSKLQTAVTEKNPTGKRASRRKSFCSRMGGMKKRLTSAKTARDPDSRINKALRRWNCEESFVERLQAIREGAYGAKDAALDAASFIPGPVGTAAGAASAYRSYKRGDYVGAALDAASTIPGLGYAAKGAKVAHAASAASKAAKGAKELDVVAKGMSTGGKAVAKGTKLGSVGSKLAKGAKVGAKLAGKGLKALGALTDGPDISGKPLGQNKSATANIRKGSTNIKATDTTPVTATKLRQHELKKPVTENKVSDLRNMLEHGQTLYEMQINGRTIQLNNTMAKRIVEVYDSVNVKNKKVVESMLNEDLESFKKLLNFSIKV